VAKVYAYWIMVNYREAYGMFAANGILFNHESPMRGETFVTRKITRAVSRILLGLETKLYLGNLSAKRDWGHAKDYVKGMWLVLQQEEPDDYVFATGKTTEIRDFVRMSFSEAGLKMDFKGNGIDEKGIITGINEYKMSETIKKSGIKEPEPVIEKAKNLIGKVIIEVDKKYFRPSEVDMLLGDYSKARTKLGWEPRYTLKELVGEMISNDIGINYRELILKNCGFEVPKSCGL
jgi:GDPmannose 4,6-dehydratase